MRIRMKRTRVHAGLAYGVIATTLLAVSVPALASTVVVPNANTSLEGDDGNSLPFGWPFGQVRYQQVYAASQFPAGLLTITAMTFRPDQFGGSAFSDTADVTIKFSTTSNGADGLSVTFSDNLGPDVTTVFSGVASISSSFTGQGRKTSTSTSRSRRHSHTTQAWATS